MEWKMWSGGSCPVDPKAKVEYKMRVGDGILTDLAENLRWAHLGRDGDVVAYRLVEPCCGVPVQCEHPDGECVIREMHHAERERPVYHPLASTSDMKHYDAIATGYEADPPGPANAGMGALGVQVGGSHYKDLKIQPVQYIHANGIPFIEGSVIKYMTRWRDKGGVKDLEKARHFIDLLIELENAKT